MAARPPPDPFWRHFPVSTFVQAVNEAWGNEFGLSATSWWRTWQENLRVGGSTRPLSQHLAGLAADVVGPPGPLGRFAGRAGRLGLVVVPYAGSHVHVQLWRRGVLDQLVYG